MRLVHADSLRTFWYRICIGLAVVSALFTFTVAVVLSVNYFHLKEADPLNADSIQSLRDRFKADPRDKELKEEIRQLDLLARRAWFGSVRFQQKGVFLLLTGCLVLVISIKTVIAMRTGRKGRLLRKHEKEKTLDHAKWVGAWVITGIAAGALLLVLFGRPPPAGPRLSTTAINKVPAAATDSARAAGENLSEGLEEGLEKERMLQWPSFRGPDGLARASEGSWPTQWDGSSGKGIVWKTAVPMGGGNSPVVWKDRVFLSGGSEDALEIYSFDAAAGSLLWSYRVQESAPGVRPTVTEDTGHAAPTMATDGERVYAVFSTGDLVALDFDGELAWQQDLGPPDNPYGHASSLITYRELLIVLYDHWASSSLMALDGVTGEIVWETFRDMDISWTSPILIRPPAGDQVVVSGNPYVAGYDPLTGDELWRVAALTGEVASSPAWARSTVFSANEYAALAAISIEGEPGIVWKYDQDLPEVSSVLAAGRRLYMSNGAGTVTCLDLTDGTVLWNHEFDEGFYSSPVLAGGNVYILDRSGTMQIFADSDSYEPMAESSLGEIANCTAAFVAGQIYLRGEENLFCIGEKIP